MILHIIMQAERFYAPEEGMNFLKSQTAPFFNLLYNKEIDLSTSIGNCSFNVYNLRTKTSFLI